MPSHGQAVVTGGFSNIFRYGVHSLLKVGVAVRTLTRNPTGSTRSSGGCQPGSFDCYHVSNPSILRAPFGCHAMFLMADAMLVAPNSLSMFITTFLRAAMTCGAEPVRT